MDAWKSKSNCSKIGVTGHWVEPSSGELRRVLLDLDIESREHTGEQLCEFLLGVLDFYELKGKIFGVSTDHAASNITMAHALSLALPESDVFKGRWSAEWNHVRCFAHDLNLVTKTIFCYFKQVLPTYDKENDDDFESEERDDLENEDEWDDDDYITEEGYISFALRSSKAVVEAESEIESLRNESDTTIHAFAKLAAFVKLVGRKEYRESYIDICKDEETRKQSHQVTIPGDYEYVFEADEPLPSQAGHELPLKPCTDWKTFYLMIRYYLMYRNSINRFIERHASEIDAESLTLDEWKCVEVVEKIFRPLHDFTFQTSYSKYASASFTLPFFHKCQTWVQEKIRDVDSDTNPGFYECLTKAISHLNYDYDKIPPIPSSECTIIRSKRKVGMVSDQLVWPRRLDQECRGPVPGIL